MNKARPKFVNVNAAVVTLAMVANPIRGIVVLIRWTSP